MGDMGPAEAGRHDGPAKAGHYDGPAKAGRHDGPAKAGRTSARQALTTAPWTQASAALAIAVS